MADPGPEPEPWGVLLTAHGSVDDLDELPAFLTRIRHGRPAPPELVREVRRRYQAIGGSPLLAISERQAAALATRLGAPVFVGMRLSRPELDQALRQALAHGLRRLCLLPLAPFSVHVYADAARRALEALSRPELELVSVTAFGSSAELVSAHANAIARQLAELPVDGTELVLTAHSLPESVIASGDPYQSEFENSARAIGAKLGRPAQIAYQSQGLGGGAWLGPDLKTVLESARARGTRHIVVAPVGFLAEHVETLYDLDVEAKAWSAELGLVFTRMPALNAAPELIEALARTVERALFR
jgi:ferrochelatase